eukprot:scaffold66094_cov34-Phaeocystis_antarctica.AAC.1
MGGGGIGGGAAGGGGIGSCGPSRNGTERAARARCAARGGGQCGCSLLREARGDNQRRVGVSLSCGAQGGSGAMREAADASAAEGWESASTPTASGACGKPPRDLTSTTASFA